jgi:uncharacterized repeat protein (TIGR03803 family)
MTCRSLLFTSVVTATLLTLCASAHSAPRYRVIHDFAGTDGSAPWGGVTLGPQGKLYGTTVQGGGALGCANGGCGTVFELTPHSGADWTESVIYNFPAGNGDGWSPHNQVAMDASGNIYGTTTLGGDRMYCGGGCGMVFELTPSSDGWHETTLLDFNDSDGAVPTAGVILDTSGNFYGTTPTGGPNGGGVAYELTPGSGGWNETILNAFYPTYNGHIAPGGSNPYAGLIADTSGNLYGTTHNGGKGYGVVFELKLSEGAWQEIVLHQFGSKGKDGRLPGGGSLLIDTSWNLYGTTTQGGANRCGEVNCGTVFRLTPNVGGGWRETILYQFKGGATGYWPGVGVVMDKSGNLYGTSGLGGSGCGVIYKLAPRPKGKWKYTVLHTFASIDGCLPAGNLVLDKKGNLYGGTVLGGPTDNGVIFKLTP